ncbi:MAG: ATP-dependent protease, partial [Dehalococcoidia bacterium]|nr:ATP-dependent protease [Dehalococcoidia bacterium]
RVTADDLTARCDPADLPFASTDELHPLDAVFGQERAARAIEFALGMTAPGYNLFAAGPDGFGKATIVESFLRRRAAQLPTPPDWVYMRNFDDPDRPVGVALPAGEGRAFADAVQEAVPRAVTELRHAFESDSYARQRQELSRQLDKRRNELLAKLREHAEQVGFALQMTPSGIVSAPIVSGSPITDEQYEQLPDDERERIQTAATGLERVVQDAMLQMRALERDTQQQAQALDDQVASFAVAHQFDPLLERWGADPEITRFIGSARADLQRERDRLRGGQQQPTLPGAPPPEQPTSALLRRYEVNVLVTRDPQAGAPVIVERHPTYLNLIGRIEYQGQFGMMVTDHTMIRPGSLALANGGFIILRLRDLLTNIAAYDGLKRALAQRALAIENLSESLGLIPTSGLRPEPMPLDAKVVIIGDSALYSLLYRADPDFRELFRVKADFETDFERTRENINGVAAVIREQCHRHKLGCFSDGAVARLVEHLSRVVDDQRRLSANIGNLIDIVRQASYWASHDGAPDQVDVRHVDRALEELEYRSALVRDRLQLLIDDGTILIDTAGGAVGQINALSVYDLGDIVFGRPSRITCVVSAGRGTIVNVERETEMAGRVHNKGFLILRGFLAARFGQEKALALHASLTFEQVYGDIDGDSASSTELYALLSALADLPISQSIAVTGSINQRGDVQPIGGATAKIEGFYEVCRARGLDGTHGVMIPKLNVHNVVLRPEVADAIRSGRFNVWAADTVETGIEVLTGVPAGTRGADGRYTEGSVFRRVEDRLDAFYHVLEQHHEAGAIDPARGPAGAAGPPPPPPGVPPGPPPPPPIRV